MKKFLLCSVCLLVVAAGFAGQTTTQLQYIVSRSSQTFRTDGDFTASSQYTVTLTKIQTLRSGHTLWLVQLGNFKIDAPSDSSLLRILAQPFVVRISRDGHIEFAPLQPSDRFNFVWRELVSGILLPFQFVRPSSQSSLPKRWTVSEATALGYFSAEYVSMTPQGFEYTKQFKFDGNLRRFLCGRLIYRLRNTLITSLSGSFLERQGVSDLSPIVSSTVSIRLAAQKTVPSSTVVRRATQIRGFYSLYAPPTSAEIDKAWLRQNEMKARAILENRSPKEVLRTLDAFLANPVLDKEQEVYRVVSAAILIWGNPFVEHILARARKHKRADTGYVLLVSALTACPHEKAHRGIVSLLEGKQTSSEKKLVIARQINYSTFVPSETILRRFLRYARAAQPELRETLFLSLASLVAKLNKNSNLYREFSQFSIQRLNAAISRSEDTLYWLDVVSLLAPEDGGAAILRIAKSHKDPQVRLRAIQKLSASYPKYLARSVGWLYKNNSGEPARLAILETIPKWAVYNAREAQIILRQALYEDSLASLQARAVNALAELATEGHTWARSLLVEVSQRDSAPQLVQREAVKRLAIIKHQESKIKRLMPMSNL